MQAVTNARRRVTAAPVAGLLGGLLLFWVAGTRLIDPREFAWLMHGDWQIHFLGWHLFRSDAWRLPPGVVASLYYPVGTTIGFTDSIPLFAFPFKLLASWLPNPFQYIGLWFLFCYTLQGLFGALVMSTWTSRALPQIVGAMVFVLLPVLFARVAHPALSAHWLLLWALWLNWRIPVSAAEDLVQHTALGLIGGLVHPYLAAMVLGLLVALSARRVLERQPVALAIVPVITAMIMTAAGWWCSGLFTISSAADLVATGGDFSANLLTMFNAGSHSAFVRGFLFFSGNQWDAYNYIGLGGLLIFLVAVPLAIETKPWGLRSVPLASVLVAFTIYAVTPLVAAGPYVLLDLREEIGQLAVFRATGRFFWPVVYVLLAAAMGVLASSSRHRFGVVVLTCALFLQAADLHKWWLEVHDGSRSPGFHSWSDAMPSSEWDELLPHYRHLRLYSPEFCRGPQPVSTPAAALRAGMFGLTINDGFAARVDSAALAALCQQFRDDFGAGVLNDDTVYLLADEYAPEFVSRVGSAAACRVIDGITTCVSSRSIALRTRDTAPPRER